MSDAKRRLIREFFATIARGEVPDTLVTPDMTFWSVNSGLADRARFALGMKALASIFGGTLTYEIDAFTAEDDRIVAEIRSHGTLVSGEAFANTHVFLFHIRDGRVASAKEYMNQFAVREKILPLLQAAMARG